MKHNQPDLDKTLNQFLRAIDQGIPFDEAKEAILAWIDKEVIGEDEFDRTEWHGNTGTLDTETSIRNELRKEQRLLLNGSKKGDSND